MQLASDAFVVVFVVLTLFVLYGRVSEIIEQIKGGQWDD